jgi:hypothetical protein
MKKIILFTLLGILPNFLMSACKKANGADLAGRTGFETSDDYFQNGSSNDTDNDISNDFSNYYNDTDIDIDDYNGYIDNSTSNDFSNYYEEQEKQKRRQIESETYNDAMLVPSITQGWNNTHFWYKSDRDSYVGGDCGLYAVLRFLHHIELIYPYEPNFQGLWKKYSNQELRNQLANLPGAREKCRKPREWLYHDELIMLIQHLLGSYVSDVSLVPNIARNGGSISALIFLE